MIELKPCPFCGMSAKVIYADDEEKNRYYRTYCRGCYAETDEYFSRDNAIEAWNRRTEK